MEGTVPFGVKEPTFLTDLRLGYPNLHEAAKEMLLWLCDFCRRNGFAKPIVTEFGRTREQIIRLYLPTYMQEAESEGVSNAYQYALAKAQNRFSWHCVPFENGKLGKVHAFDIREWVFTAPVQQVIYEAACSAYPAAHYELLLHAVPGGAKHFHFAFKDPRGRPNNWL